MQTLVVNTHTSAISTYEEYPFNSYCEVDGVYFGASATGLYRLDKGNNDAGQSINAGVGTGIMDLGSPMLKRLLDASATMRSDGGIRLTINVDEAARHAAVTLPMIPRASSGLVKYRGTVPKGLRGKAWQFELENVNGDQFEFAELSIASMPVLRRV